jgi:integrase
MAKARRTKTRGVKSLGDGKYELRIYVTDPKTGRQKELERIVEAESVTEAAAKRLALRSEYLEQRNATRPPRPESRLADAVTSWLGSVASSLKPSTRSTYATACDCWIDALGDYLLDRIEPGDVRQVLDRWRAEGLSTDTVNGRLRVLKTFAKATKCTWMIEDLTSRTKTVHEVEDDEDEGRGLELHELRSWLEVGPTARTDASWPRWWALLETLAWTGMRFGEASALEWRDVDLEGGSLRVRRAVWRGEVGHPKARASRREIALPDELVTLLREHRDRMLREQAAGVELALVFPSPFAGRVSKRGVVAHTSNTGARKAMLTVCATAKINLAGRPTLHCLRHTLNNLVRQQAPEIVRQAIIGHADETIGERYSKVGVDEKRAALSAVVALVRRKTGGQTGGQS